MGPVFSDSEYGVCWCGGSPSLSTTLPTMLDLGEAVWGELSGEMVMVLLNAASTGRVSRQVPAVLADWGQPCCPAWSEGQ